ncbi:MAG: hypothetical protein WC249_01890 [Patescibacteria group bacterium]|jgi:hypothetical protein
MDLNKNIQGKALDCAENFSQIINDLGDDQIKLSNFIESFGKNLPLEIKKQFSDYLSFSKNHIRSTGIKS